jgi:hypothetical protein
MSNQGPEALSPETMGGTETVGSRMVSTAVGEEGNIEAGLHRQDIPIIRDARTITPTFFIDDLDVFMSLLSISGRYYHTPK